MSSTGMITQGIVDQTQPKSQFKTMVQKIRCRNKRVAPDPESMTRAVLAEFQKLLSTGGERPTGDFRRPSLGGGQKGSDKTRLDFVMHLFEIGKRMETNCNKIYWSRIVFPYPTETSLAEENNNWLGFSFQISRLRSIPSLWGANFLAPDPIRTRGLLFWVCSIVIIIFVILVELEQLMWVNATAVK